jgi:hypothetical protein
MSLDVSVHKCGPPECVFVGGLYVVVIQLTPVFDDLEYHARDISRPESIRSYPPSTSKYCTHAYRLDSKIWGSQFWPEFDPLILCASRCIVELPADVIVFVFWKLSR